MAVLATSIQNVRLCLYYFIRTAIFILDYMSSRAVMEKLSTSPGSSRTENTFRILQYRGQISLVGIGSLTICLSCVPNMNAIC